MRHNNKGGTRGQLARSMPDRRHAARVRPLEPVPGGPMGFPCGSLLADRRALPVGTTKLRINVTPGRLPAPWRLSWRPKPRGGCSQRTNAGPPGWFRPPARQSADGCTNPSHCRACALSSVRRLGPLSPACSRPRNRRAPSARRASRLHGGRVPQAQGTQAVSSDDLQRGPD
jgi:hypothetical protein